MQIFFSLGPCWGSLITLASYNKFNNNTLRDAVFVASANCLTSFFAGFVVFSFIGFMAHSVNKDIEDVIVSGPGLAFVVYPEAVSKLPFPHLWWDFYHPVAKLDSYSSLLFQGNLVLLDVALSWPWHPVLHHGDNHQDCGWCLAWSHISQGSPGSGLQSHVCWWDQHDYQWWDVCTTDDG